MLQSRRRTRSRELCRPARHHGRDKLHRRAHLVCSRTMGCPVPAIPKEQGTTQGAGKQSSTCSRLAATSLLRSRGRRQILGGGAWPPSPPSCCSCAVAHRHGSRWV